MNPTLPPDRIQWHEGMLLSPQHFQQESARVDQLIAWHQLAADPLAWGVRRLEIDEGMLTSGLLRVTRLEAVMPDGMAVAFDAANSHGLALELELPPFAEAMEQERELPVYLTLGRSRSQRDPGQPARLRGVAAEPVDDEVSQALPVDIPRAAPNLALAAGEVPSSLYVHMKLLTVRKANQVFRRGDFVPALLDMPRENDLHRRAQALASQMRSKAAFLAKQTSLPSARLEDRVSQLEQKARLSSLVLSLPPLEAVLRAPAVRPYALYLALCAQLGPLSTLRAGAVPMLPPAWNPADPLAALGPVLESLQELVAEVSQDWRTQQFTFDGTAAFSLDLRQAWLGQRLVVGLRGPNDRDLAAWMAGAVIGSRSTVGSLAERRVLGATRRRIDEAPELGVRASAGYLLFAVEPAAGVVAAGEPLVISNTNETSATQRPQEVVLFVKG